MGSRKIFAIALLVIGSQRASATITAPKMDRCTYFLTAPAIAGSNTQSWLTRSHLSRFLADADLAYQIGRAAALGESGYSLLTSQDQKFSLNFVERPRRESFDQSIDSIELAVKMAADDFVFGRLDARVISQAWSMPGLAGHLRERLIPGEHLLEALVRIFSEPAHLSILADFVRERKHLNGNLTDVPRPNRLTVVATDFQSLIRDVLAGAPFPDQPNLDIIWIAVRENWISITLGRGLRATIDVQFRDDSTRFEMMRVEVKDSGRSLQATFGAQEPGPTLESLESAARRLNAAAKGE